MAIPAAVDSGQNNKPLIGTAQEVFSAAAAAGQVQVAVLHDDEYQLHVLYPSHSLLDINLLRRLSGRALRAMHPAEVQKLCEQRGLLLVSAQPGALGLAMAVDNRLLQASSLLLSAGDTSLLQVDGAQFRLGLESALIGDFSVPLADLQRTELEQIDDVAEITAAVTNFTTLRLMQRLEETLELPPLPATAQCIIELRVDPYADARALSGIVEADPALAAQIVSWASSSYYGYTGKIKSVQDAIVRVLGFDLVSNLALGLALGKSLNLPKDSPQGFTQYWQQAVYGATAVEALVGCIRAQHRPTIGLAYLTGLLHNFGYLLLAEIFPPHFSTYCRYQEANRTISYAPIERFLLGVTRDQLAGWLMGLWSMPEEVIAGLRFQNEADYVGPHSEYANLIFVATRLLRRHGIGNAPLESIPAALYERLHLDPEKAAQVIQQVVDASAELNHFG
jgi:HD-like signal output (HDOD) protein